MYNQQTKILIPLHIYETKGKSLPTVSVLLPTYPVSLKGLHRSVPYTCHFPPPIS